LGTAPDRFTVEPRSWVCLEALGDANVPVFSQLDLCYNTGHEFDIGFDPAFIRFHDVAEGG